MNGTIILSADAGAISVQATLSAARQDALWRREIGFRPSERVLGMFNGQLIVTAAWLRPDPDRLMAAENEIRFLLGPYLTQPRGAQP